MATDISSYKTMLRKHLNTKICEEGFLLMSTNMGTYTTNSIVKRREFQGNTVSTNVMIFLTLIFKSLTTTIKLCGF